MAIKKGYLYSIVNIFILVFFFNSCIATKRKTKEKAIHVSNISPECLNNITILKNIFDKFNNNQITSDIKIDSILCEYKSCIKNMDISTFKQNFPNLIFNKNSIIELKVVSAKNYHLYSSHKLVFIDNKLKELGSGRSFIEGMSARDNFNSDLAEINSRKYNEKIYKSRFQKYLDCFNN